MGTASGANAGDSYLIVVTAQKREQNLQNVGVSITVLAKDALQERGIQSLSDIAQAVPSLSYTNSANNTPIYTPRGVGFCDTFLGFYPTTSVYLDDSATAFKGSENTFHAKAAIGIKCPLRVFGI